MRTDADSSADIGNSDVAGAWIEPGHLILCGSSNGAARAIVSLDLHPGQIGERAEARRPPRQERELLAVVDLEAFDLRFAAVVLRGQCVPGVFAIKTVVRSRRDRHSARS